VAQRNRRPRNSDPRNGASQGSRHAGFDIWDIGALIDPKKIVPAGPAFLGEESLRAIEHAIAEAARLELELGMIAASSWNAGGAWVEKSDGSKRLASSALDLVGPMKFTGTLPLPCDDETYYRDVFILAVPRSEDKEISSLELVRDLSSHMDDEGRLQWDVPEGIWTVLRFVDSESFTGWRHWLDGPGALQTALRCRALCRPGQRPGYRPSSRRIRPAADSPWRCSSCWPAGSRR